MQNSKTNPELLSLVSLGYFSSHLLGSLTFVLDNNTLMEIQQEIHFKRTLFRKEASIEGKLQLDNSYLDLPELKEQKSYSI